MESQPPMQIDLTDKVALITGSARRVGRAIALELARRGVHILVHYNSSADEAVRETLHDIKSHGVDAFSVQANISTADGVAHVFDRVKSQFRRLNILVNSASVFHQNELMDITLEDWQRSLDVNLTAPFLCTQAAVRLMRENDPPGGAIINLLDFGSVRPWPQRLDHGVSKAGLLSLTENSAAALGSENIRVNGVLPGPVMKSPGLSDARWAEIGAALPIGRPGDAGDVARAVAYLAGEDFITGTVLKVNGGEDLNK